VPEEAQQIGGIAVSVQDDGQTIGLHVEMPGTQFAVKFPLDYAERLRNEFPGMIDAAIAECKKQQSGIITPPSPSGKLHIAKGK
jgi:hypothetical protein